MQAVLDGATLDTSQRAEGEDPAVIKGDQEKEKEVQVTAGQVLVEMHVTDWAAAQKEDPELDAVLLWLGSMLQVRRARWFGEIVKLSLPSKAPFICAPCQKGRMRICYSLWC